jgi:3-dehydroquinate dehydratase-1
MQLLDIEMFRDAGSVAKLIKLAHDKKVLVIMSNHDFAKHLSNKTLKTVC